MQACPHVLGLFVHACADLALKLVFKTVKQCLINHLVAFTSLIIEYPWLSIIKEQASY